MPARHEQIGQRAGHEQAKRVLLQPAIVHFGKAEHPPDDPDRMFDPGPHFRLGSVFRPLKPKYHWLPFLVWCISGSRAFSAFLVEDGALMIVASTIVPVATFSPFAARCRCTSSNSCWPRSCVSSR